MSASSPPDPPYTTTISTTTTTNSPRSFSNPPHPQLDPMPSLLPTSLLQSQLHPSPTTTAFVPPPPPPPQRQPPQQQSLYNNSNPRVLYPVASSGRGFFPKPAGDQHVAIANSSAGFPPRPVAPYQYPVRPFGFTHSDPHGHWVRPAPHLQQTLIGSTGGVVPSVVKGVPISTNLKVASPPSSVSNCNGLKDSRDTNKDETFITVRDRKVKISEGSSLYAQLRSWVKNGVPEENQPHYVDCVKSLPKPLPAMVGDSNSQIMKDDNEEEENEESVENLSPKELLQQHIGHAKKVRARLREERLQRIARYKGRLALLLPPAVEQQLKNDSASGN